jgi:hypothetical protein
MGNPGPEVAHAYLFIKIRGVVRDNPQSSVVSRHDFSDPTYSGKVVSFDFNELQSWHGDCISDGMRPGSQVKNSAIKNSCFAGIRTRSIQGFPARSGSTSFREVNMKELNLIQNPRGSWSFVGWGLPIDLVWARKDNQPLTDKDVDTIQHCSAPALFGYKTAVFSTRDEATAIANDKGYSIKGDN